MGELGVKQKVVTVHCDNSSALHLYRNLAHHEKTKHIDITYENLANQL